MQLYVLRHGIAEDHSPSGADEDRRLTDEGRRKLRVVLQRARDAGVKPELILTSPYVRARQTAEVAIEELDVGSLVIGSNFFPFSRARETWKEILEYRQMTSVMITGHNPHLSELVSLAVGGGSFGVGMKKAALAALELGRPGPEPRGELHWLLTPKTAGA